MAEFHGSRGEGPSDPDEMEEEIEAAEEEGDFVPTHRSRPKR